MIAERASERTERESLDLSERTMRSRKENGVQRV